MIEVLQWYEPSRHYIENGAYDIIQWDERKYVIGFSTRSQTNVVRVER